MIIGSHIHFHSVHARHEIDKDMDLELDIVVVDSYDNNFVNLLLYNLISFQNRV